MDRSENMRRIRSGGTLPELRVRRALHSLGYRFRLHRKDLPGKPDIVLPRHKVIVFVHGCFWHQHAGCIDGKLPKTRQEYWLPKLRRNVERDQQVQNALRELGWTVVTVWDCETVPEEQLKDLLKERMINT